jgi:hypothetical protein
MERIYRGIAMKKILKVMAITVWYIGFIALTLKSLSLFSQAYALESNPLYLISFLALLFILVPIKMRYIFIRSCQNNMERIEKLNEPKLWQFYRMGFFLFLITVILLGAFLSRWATGDYWLLMGVGIFDMALALSLFFSCLPYYQNLAPSS